MRKDKQDAEAKRIHNEWRARKGVDYLRELTRKATSGKRCYTGSDGKDDATKPLKREDTE